MTNYNQFNRDVVFGRSGGQIIWQPRIGCWYTDKIFAKEKLPERYDGKTLPEIYRELGCSARPYEFGECYERVEHPSVRIYDRKLNETDTETVVETPVGKQTSIYRYTPDSPFPMHVKWEVVTEEELKVAAWREENTAWKWNGRKYDELFSIWGDLAAPTMFMPRMNVQSLFLEKMGVENAIYAIYDWPDTAQAYFSALEESHARLIDVINKSPVDIINYGENVHSWTLSPELFEKFHLPACIRRTEKLHAAGKFVYSHWDGYCKPLLKYAKQTTLDGIEAITPVPQGDVTIDEIKEALGDEMFLLDGIPAIYFDELYPVETLIECTEKLIRLFAPKLVLGVSDEISSTGDIERVRVVGDIVERYNKSVIERNRK